MKDFHSETKEKMFCARPQGTVGEGVAEQARSAQQLKAITSKRKKTEDDLLEMARIEWLASL